MGTTIESYKFCKLSPAIVDENIEAFTGLVAKPKYVCMKCFRTSRNKKNLCKPQKIKKLTSK